jgi:hypothetical protein
MLLRAYLLVAATLFACSSAIRPPPQTPLCATADCARIPRLSVDGRNGNGAVLRLQVSTLNETIALRQAADDSLLEVLASNQHWVDVRISQAMVRNISYIGFNCVCSFVDVYIFAIVCPFTNVL